MSSPENNEGKPGSYQTMDYGPVLAESIKMDWPENGLVRKGLAIRLDHNAAMIFDTDLMRFATGTVNGWLDISETDYTSYKGSDIASLEGRQVFATSEIAGWAKDGSFNGPREDGLGNLPRDWAQYHGYYRNDDQVVLSYSVGETNVLEWPEAIQHGESVAFARTLRVEASDQAMKALITEKRDSWSIDRATDQGIILNTEDGAFAVQLAGPADDAKLAEGEQGRIELHLQPSDGPRTVRVLLFEMSSSGDNLFDEIRRTYNHAEMPDLKAMTQGGPAHWSEEIEVSGDIAEDESGYVLDRIPLPFDNPWGSWLRLSGLDFFEDGTRAAVSTWNGDVWIVSGIDETLENVKWRRFASGLFYPMGLAIVNDDIYVTERSQLTRLHDLNGNGEADYYESFNNDGIVHPMAHSLGLDVDSDGYFYFFKNGNRASDDIPQHGALVRVSPDGMEREVYSRGSRGANTLGIGADDVILSADQQGNWVPVERIDVMKKNGFYGFRPHGGEGLPVGEFEPPVSWIPYDVNNSSGSITYSGDSRWGPLAGQWVLGSYGQSRLLLVLTEEIGGKLQGGVVELPIETESGVIRGSINPGDGQLYLAGLRGWTTLGTEDGSLERVRYAGGRANLPKAIRVNPDGVEIEFTDPVDRSSAQNVENYNAQRWEYIYSGDYGSSEYSLENPEEEGRDPVEITAASVSEDGRRVTLEIADMRSVMQMEIAYELTFEDGQKAKNSIYHTVNWLSEADVDHKPEWQQRIMARAQEPVEDAVPEAEVASVETDAPEWFQQGQILFERNCSECHGGDGVAPAMGASEWAGGSREALVRILLQGKRGDQGIMTPFSWMGDEDIASILSYIRSNWHDKEQITQDEVNQVRKATEGRRDLWTDEELEEY
ncbi:MAG: DUF6797 domain-containing protein [Balneolales bacterium]